MSSHHRSGGPPSLMDDVHDFDRNFHSHRFESDRGGRGRGGGMRGRGGVGGGRGRGDGNFGPRGGVRGGRGDFHQRDRFNNNFNRPNDDHHRSGGNNQSKMPSLLDPDQQQSRPYDRDNNNRHGRMPYSRGGAHDSSGDGPPPLLDFGNDKSGLPASINNNSLPSLLSVQLENSGMPPSDSDKPNDSHKDYQHGDRSSSRSDHHSSSHRDSDNRYRDRDSHRSNRGGYNRPSSYNRDRSRSPRDRDHDHDRHGGHSREDRPYGGDHRRGGRGGGRDNYGRGGGGRGDHHHHREGHQSRFGPSDNNQQSWQDRRGGGGRGGFGGSGRGGFQEHQREIGPHRPNEQLPSDNHPFDRDGRPNFDRSPSQNRPFQEGFPHGNFDPMSGGLPGHNRPNFNQGPPLNRPDFYPPNANNPPYQQHNPRTGGRPSRFSDRQDEYEDDRPLTKPNFSLLNANTTTTPLYINQPNNPTYSQPRPQMTSTFSSQHQAPSLAGLFPPGGPAHHQPPGQFGWSNPQGQQAPIGPNPLMNPSLSTNDQQNSNLPGGHPSGNNFYGNTSDFHRQQQQPPSATNPYFSGVPPVLPQAGAKPPNVQPNPVAIPSQQMPPVGATASGTTANADAWQQYYQQYWQYVQQQQQQQQTGVQPPATSMTTPQPTFPQVQPGSATAPKQPSTAGSTTGNTQDAAMTQASTEAWTQYWIQCQAYMQQQQQLQQQTQTSAANSATIAAPSQLYPQTAGKQPQTSSNPNSSNTAPQSSNWQTWFTTK